MVAGVEIARRALGTTRSVVLVQASPRVGDGVRHVLELAQQRRGRVPPRLGPRRLVQRLGSLLGGLLGQEACSLEATDSRQRRRRVEVELRLS